MVLVRIGYRVGIVLVPEFAIIRIDEMRHIPSHGLVISACQGIGHALVCVLYGSASVPAVGIVCLKVEIMPERLGIYRT